MAYKPIVYKEKSLADRTRDGLIFMAVGLFVLYMLQRFIDFLFRPLHTDGSGSIRDMIETKQEARRQYLKAIEEDGSDPMSQFQERFIKLPESYKRDKDNEIYKKWYQAWKRGEILDSTLRWVPKIYKRDDSFNPKFIEYLKIQYALHKRASLYKKMVFIGTIRKYYPEFTASFHGLANDLPRYSSMMKEEKLQTELEREIEKFGLPEELAKYLAGKDLKVAKLKEQAVYLKECVARGYLPRSSILGLENGFKVGDVDSIHSMEASGFPPEIAVSVLKGELSKEGFEEIKEEISIIRETFSEERLEEVLESGRTFYEEQLLEKLDEVKIEKRAEKFYLKE
jgi:hypothetical protein